MAPSLFLAPLNRCSRLSWLQRRRSGLAVEINMSFSSPAVEAAHTLVSGYSGLHERKLCTVYGVYVTQYGRDR